jgi:hypothetical protein
MRKSAKSQPDEFPRRRRDARRQEQVRGVRHPQPVINTRRNIPRRGAR